MTNTKSWVESGLEFEYRVERILNRNKWTIHYEYSYELLRNIPEMQMEDKEFVDCSIDLSPIKSFNAYKSKYFVTHQLFIEAKYFDGNFFFLKPNNILKDNTKNQAVYTFNPTLLRSFSNFCRDTLPKNKWLYKGIAINNKFQKNKDLIKRSINQLFFASIDHYSQVYFNNYPTKKTLNQKGFSIYSIHPIIVTNSNLYVRNRKVIKNENDTNFNQYFNKIPYGVIFVPFKTRFYKFQQYIFNEYYRDKRNFINSPDDVFNDYLLMETPTRCYVVQIDHLTRFLNEICKNFNNTSKDVFQSSLARETERIETEFFQKMAKDQMKEL